MNFSNYPFVTDQEISELLEGATIERLRYLKWLHQTFFDFYRRSPFYQKESQEKHLSQLNFFTKVVAECESRINQKIVLNLG